MRDITLQYRRTKNWDNRSSNT